MRRNENSMEELRMLLVDLSSKPKDEWMLSNAWVTTTAGEIHDAGLVKMAGESSIRFATQNSVIPEG